MNEGKRQALEIFNEIQAERALSTNHRRANAREGGEVGLGEEGCGQRGHAFGQSKLFQGRQSDGPVHGVEVDLLIHQSPESVGGGGVTISRSWVIVYSGGTTVPHSIKSPTP